MKELATTINSHGGADVIAVDTVAQTTPGANENSSEDMGKLIAHCRTLHELTGATIMLIHHAGKDATRGARGWSGLRAAVDAEIEITRNGDDRVARISKMKDGEDNARFPFELRKIVIGYDADGDARTSIAVEHVLRPIAVTAPQPKGAHQIAVYRALTELQSGAVASRVRVEAVIDRALPHMVRDPTTTDPKKQDRRRFMALRALDALANRGAVHVQDDYVWLHGGASPG